METQCLQKKLFAGVLFEETILNCIFCARRINNKLIYKQDKYIEKANFF